MNDCSKSPLEKKVFAVIPLVPLFTISLCYCCGYCTWKYCRQEQDPSFYLTGVGKGGWMGGVRRCLNNLSELCELCDLCEWFLWIVVWLVSKIPQCLRETRLKCMWSVWVVWVVWIVWIPNPPSPQHCLLTQNHCSSRTVAIVSQKNLLFLASDKVEISRSSVCWTCCCSARLSSTSQIHWRIRHHGGTVQPFELSIFTCFVMNCKEKKVVKKLLKSTKSSSPFSCLTVLGCHEKTSSMWLISLVAHKVAAIQSSSKTC
jgi:hypothetical protein